MPRERIQHGALTLFQGERAPGEAVQSGKPWHPGDPVPEGYVLREAPSLDVNWNRDGGWVQVSIDAPRDWWESFIESYRGSPEQHNFAAYTETMTRREINTLIRVLRRARDAAHGADE